MSHELNPRTVGLFGTCGASTWRNPFIHMLAENRIPYFNPQLPEGTWTPEMAAVEAWHLANDKLILFPVTGETFAFGSLAETGFSIQSALSLTSNRFVMLYIAPDVSDALKASDPVQADASRRARKLALAHLANVSNPNVFIAKSLDDMLAKTMRLYAALEILDSVRDSGPDWRSTLPPEAWLDIVRGVSAVSQDHEVAVAGAVA